MKQIKSAITILGITFLLALGVSSAQAHTIQPAIVTVTFETDGSYALEISTNIETLIAGIGPEHEDTDDSPNAKIYNELRKLSPDELEASFEQFAPDFLASLRVNFDDRLSNLQLSALDIPAVGDIDLARKSRIILSGDVPASASTFIWAYPETYGGSVLRIRRSGSDSMVSAWLQPGQVSEPYLLTQDSMDRSVWSIGWDYTKIGFTHILPLGLDHILFVLGIFLLQFQWRPVLYQVTAFTIAHTITLGMSIYGLISLAPSIVEPLIALSIVYVGVENILLGTLKPWRIAIVFLFGLLHGMGFAGVLSEIGLPDTEFLLALVTFNIGVELGQIAVIVLAFLVLGWFREKPWYRARIVIPLSALISLIGLYWAIERVI